MASALCLYCVCMASALRLYGVGNLRLNAHADAPANRVRWRYVFFKTRYEFFVPPALMISKSLGRSSVSVF